MNFSNFQSLEEYQPAIDARAKELELQEEQVIKQAIQDQKAAEERHMANQIEAAFSRMDILQQIQEEEKKEEDKLKKKKEQEGQEEAKKRKKEQEEEEEEAKEKEQDSVDDFKDDPAGNVDH
jgi:hypothetical protein